MNLNLSRSLRWLILIGILLIPFIALIVANSMFFPFITGKAFTFRILIEILAGLWLILMLISPEHRPKSSLLLWAVLSLLTALTISTIFSVNPDRSFWSNFERMEGLISYLHLFLFFLIAGSVLIEKKWWGVFFKAVLATSLILSVYGFFQLLGKIQIIQGAGRVESTFGNATYLAAFLLISVFLSLFMWWRDQNRPWAKFIYPALFLVQVVMLFNTETRGAALGFVGGLVLMLGLIAWRGRTRPRLRLIAVITILCLVLLTSLFLVFRQSAFVNNNQVLHRLATISLKAGETRFAIWQMALEGFKERPIFGWGPENFIAVFDKFYDPQLHGAEEWFDRAHNIFLDWLVNTGIIGFLIYLSVYAVMLYYIWRYREPDDLIEPSILTGLLSAYLIQNIFVFDNLMSYILFLSLAAYLHHRAVEKRTWPAFDRRTLAPIELAPISIGAAVLVAVIIYFVNAKPIMASRGLIRALSSSAPEARFESFEKILTRKTFGNAEFRVQLASEASQILGADQVDLSWKQKFFDLAERELKLQVAASPLEARYPLYLGLLLKSTGRSTEAIEYLELARQRSPRKQTILLALADAYLVAGDKDKALEITKKAYDSAPKYQPARMAYGLALIYHNRLEEAEKILSSIKVPVASLINAYLAIGDYQSVLQLWQQRVEAEPDNMQFRFNLAAAYLQVGERRQAIASLTKAMELDPNVSEQANYLIGEIRAGRNPLPQ